MNLLKRLVVEEEGQGLVEYAMIIGVVAIGVILAAGGVGDAIAGLWGRIAGDIGTVAP